MPRFDILTLHPKMVDGPLSESIIGRARSRGSADVRVHDIREDGIGKHRTVDDSPYGGGPGMVMRVDVVARALERVKTTKCRVLLTTPSGRVFDQSMAEELLSCEQVVLICGHYEGIDDRIETLVDDCVSLGDFVMTGGEIAAIAIVDAVVRLQADVLGNSDSSVEESFSQGLLEYPQYTRPQEYEGLIVPDVLMSGHHANVATWRMEQRVERTRTRRPDLYARWVRKNQSKEVDINPQSVDDSSDVE